MGDVQLPAYNPVKQLNTGTLTVYLAWAICTAVTYVGVLWMDFPAFMGPSYAEKREVGHAVSRSNGSDAG